MPKYSVLCRAVNQWENKLRWRVALADNPIQTRYRLKSRFSTPPCPISNERLDEVIKSVHDTVLLSWYDAQKLRKNSNICSLTKLSYKLIRDSRLLFYTTDKDGGFAAAEASAVLIEMHRILSSSDYKRVLRSSYFNSDLADAFRRACFTAVACESENWSDQNKMMGELMHDFRFRTPNAWAARLDLTVKTHKNQGEVVARALHTSNISPLKPALRYVSRCLRDFVTSQAHILRDSSQLAKLLAGVTVESDQSMLKIDIEDFFMSGRHSKLLELCAPKVPACRREGFKQMLAFVLDNQFVEVVPTSLYIWKVVQGSGMGLECSREVSDTAFHCLAEESVVLNPTIRRKYRITFYARFRDDIFIILGGEDCSSKSEFFAEFSKRSDFFKLKVDCLNKCEVPMLDLRIFRGRRWHQSRVLDVGMYEKATAQGVPLDDSSWHPTQVHLSWSVVRCRHFDGLCSNESLATEAKLEFLHKLCKFCPTHANIASVIDSIRLPLLRRTPIPKKPGTWLVLPFHRVFRSVGLKSRLDHTRNLFERNGYERFQPNVSWSLGGPNLLMRMQRHARYLIRGSPGKISIYE